MKVNNLEELRITFAVEIVPLLQDYFYNDYKKLEEDILNSDFIDSNEMMIKEEWQKDNQAFKTAINKILGQLSEWLIGGQVQKIVLAISSVETKETLERWTFNVETDQDSLSTGKTQDDHFL